MYSWHKHQNPSRNVHLHIVAGSGNEGVQKKSAAGGSVDSYKGIVDRYNGTNFPDSIDADGNKRGGDKRMDYASVNYTHNERGPVSGSVMRKFARDNDHENPDHVREFKKLLHSNFSDEHAKHLMKTIKERTPVKESVWCKIKEIINE
jgi:hypothetical protein